MASKFRKLFGKKDDGYYEGPDLLSSSSLPTRDAPYPLGQSSLRSKGGIAQYWQDFDAEPSAAYTTVRIPRLPSRPYDASTPAQVEQQSGPPSGYRAASRLASVTSSTHSPEFLSHSSASSPDRPFFPRRRINYVDLLDATGSSQRSNSSLSYQSQRTSQYNEDIAERNGIERVAQDADAFNPTYASVKYQEHVADRNIRFDAGSLAGDHGEKSSAEEALPDLSRSPDSASSQSKMASPERPGTSHSTSEIYRAPPLMAHMMSPERPETSYSAAEKYRPPPSASQVVPLESPGTSYSAAEIYRPPPPALQDYHEPKDGMVEKSIRRSSSVRSNQNKPSQRMAQENGSFHPKKSLPDMTTKRKEVETVGIAISTDQSWLQKPYQGPLASANRRSSRRILDLTEDKIPLEIIPISRKQLDSSKSATNDTSYHASHYSGDSLPAPAPPVLRVKTAIENKDPQNTLDGGPNSPNDADEETTPRPISRTESKPRTKDPLSHDLPHQRSIETLRKKHSLQFSSANIYNPNDDLFPPPLHPSQPHSRLPTLPSMSSIHHATSGPVPSTTTPNAPRTRPTSVDTAPSMPLRPPFQLHHREPTTSSVKLTPIPGPIYVPTPCTHSTNQVFSYAPEGSLYDDNTLLLPGLDASHISAGDDDFTLSGGLSPLPSTEAFDTMIDSFQSYSQGSTLGPGPTDSFPSGRIGRARGHARLDSIQSQDESDSRMYSGSGSGSGSAEPSRPSTAGGKSLYSIPPFQVPRRDSSLKAVVGGGGTAAEEGYFAARRV